MLFRIFQKDALANLELSGENYTYLTRVLRLAENSKFEVMEGTPNIKIYTIQKIGKSALQAVLLDTYQENNESSLRLSLAQAFLKADKLELVLQKATELGVFEFLLYESENSPVKLKNLEPKLERWRKIIQSAVCQSRRDHCPELKIFKSLEELLKRKQRDTFFADQSEAAVKLPPLAADCEIIIGPESGFSAAEKQLLCSQHIPAVSLGPRTLRTETAALAVCARILLN